MAANSPQITPNADGSSTFHLGDFTLLRGGRIPDAKVVFKTWGEVNAAGDNVVVIPSCYAGTWQDNEWLVEYLRPEQNFVVTLCMFGNGQSSSPSNTPFPFDGPKFPKIMCQDNVRAQKIVCEALGMKKARLVVGWSMGAQQSYMWASMYPDLVERILPFCGSARTSPHNFVFLEGPKSALLADPDFFDGWYYKRNLYPERGMRAFARVYSGWAFSQEWFRRKLYETVHGCNGLEDWLVGKREAFWCRQDPNDLLCMLWTWQNMDLSDTEEYKKDYALALSSLKCRAIVMPCRTDLYFPPEDSEIEVSHMKNAELVVIESCWGHIAGAGGWKEDNEVIGKQCLRILDMPALA
ncbi:alpha/beta hydrolase protein [Hyaloraphidium curvatum]|nr:alpha/beta hydrolase protein [Hyaloraphidium curvatum]